MTCSDEIFIVSDSLELTSLNQSVQTATGSEGAAVVFTGTVRAGSGEKKLVGMFLEHYPGMTEKQLERIIAEARERWSLGKITVAHRVGELKLGEPIVFVGVSAAHRREAFEACEFIMDYLKTKATFWKKEIFEDSAAWVEARNSDEDAAARWL